MNGTGALKHTIREKALAKGFDFNMGDVKYPECRRTNLPGRDVHKMSQRSC